MSNSTNLWISPCKYEKFYRFCINQLSECRPSLAGYLLFFKKKQPPKPLYNTDVFVSDSYT